MITKEEVEDWMRDEIDELKLCLNHGRCPSHERFAIQRRINALEEALLTS